MEVEDILLLDLKNKANHKELILMLGRLLSSITSLTDVTKQSVKPIDISKLESNLNSINSKLDLTSIPKSIEILTISILKKLDELKQPKIEVIKDWTFTVTNRDSHGNIKIVKAKAV